MTCYIYYRIAVPAIELITIIGLIWSVSITDILMFVYGLGIILLMFMEIIFSFCDRKKYVVWDIILRIYCASTIICGLVFGDMLLKSNTGKFDQTYYNLVFGLIVGWWITLAFLIEHFVYKTSETSITNNEYDLIEEDGTIWTVN